MLLTTPLSLISIVDFEEATYYKFYSKKEMNSANNLYALGSRSFLVMATESEAQTTHSFQAVRH